MITQPTYRAWYDKLLHLDRRIVYLLVLIVVAFPLLSPIALPLRVSPTVSGLYDGISTLKAGDAVLFSYDYSASGAGDITPQVEALLRHIITIEGVRVVAVSFWPEGPVITEETLMLLERAGKQYGTDYINLGYCAGAESAIAQFAQNVTSAFPNDFRGKPTDSYPVMKELKTVKDFALVVDFAAGSPGPREMVRQFENEYGKAFAVGCSSNLTATLMPYYDAGQIFAVLSGLRGAAEYESLTEMPGKGSAGMGSQTFGHLLIIALLVLGNIGYAASKRSIKGVTTNE